MSLVFSFGVSFGVIFLFLNADGVAMWSRSVGVVEDGLWVC
jgi:hypothetical protein